MPIRKKSGNLFNEPYIYVCVCVCVCVCADTLTTPIGLVVECSPMTRDTGVQSQVESYERLKKWFLIPPCLTLSIIRYVSRVKWSNPGKGVAPSPISRCSSYRKGSFRVALDYGRQLYLLLTRYRAEVYFSKRSFFILLQTRQHQIILYLRSHVCLAHCLYRTN